MPQEIPLQILLGIPVEFAIRSGIPTGWFNSSLAKIIEKFWKNFKYDFSETEIDSEFLAGFVFRNNFL